MTWKPEGYPAVSPYLVVTGAEETLDFLDAVFGATLLRRFDTPEGEVMHAEVRIGDSVVMIGEAGGEWRPVPAFVHVYVSDVDATYRRALTAGAEEVQPPERRDGDPDRRGGFRDPGGNTWWVATQGGA
ncbi:MAG: VOC family protein [Actinobacteria bacterium]|nr:VOC family protein [Gemmatimonadota bacterium]NIU20625.1 VOC family protein [Actinomycetota bacterium]NIU77202.1 VOC family protein [Gammaproteobacteria bacterium]NIV57120.1 VOC family protein [Actinomycetota bacterium]NIW35952.1 VOC family protein [Gemmatimonadota bacterium]